MDKYISIKNEESYNYLKRILNIDIFIDNYLNLFGELLEKIVINL